MIDTNKVKILAITGIVFLGIVAAAMSGWVYFVSLPTGKTEDFVLEITPGMTAGDVANLLDDNDVIRSVLYFKFISERKGYSKKFKAGKHVVSGIMRMNEIARLLTQNPPSPPDIKVTVFEGITIEETASILMSEADIDSVEFVKLTVDENLIRELGIDNDTLEGYLYPDTYFVRHGTEPHEMITRMVGKFKQVFSDSLEKRASEIGMSVNEVVILASIIETEAGRKEERPLVSSVFHRRLIRGRPLEANPTIQYALGSKRRVLLEDLDIDSPYNTYTNSGLPPAPIASPGRESILAALYPADTKYLYFMADGRGGHVFSRTLKEHNRAVIQYKRFRKQVNKN